MLDQHDWWLIVCSQAWKKTYLRYSQQVSDSPLFLLRQLQLAAASHQKWIEILVWNPEGYISYGIRGAPAATRTSQFLRLVEYFPARFEHIWNTSRILIGALGIPLTSEVLLIRLQKSKLPHSNSWYSTVVSLGAQAYREESLLILWQLVQFHGIGLWQAAPLNLWREPIFRRRQLNSRWTL